MRFPGRVVLVTGGARGQGRSHAVAFAREGADVVVCDLCDDLGTSYPSSTVADLEETRRLVEAVGGRCLAVRADVREPAQLRALVARARTELGPVDVLVANAGILDNARIEELDPVRFDHVLATNLGGVFHAIQAVLPDMLERRAGQIVAISSMAGRRAYGRAAHYTASKWGVIGLAKDVALDLAPFGITVNVVCPASVNTVMAVNDHLVHAFLPDREEPTLEEFEAEMAKLHPQQVPWVEPEDVSAAVLFLASPEARHITGEVMTVSAGMMAQNSS
ncbi:NAD(P)-dependent oxidoreductase [Nocardioides mangrovicus]|uniref:NAD(P)-dependent oxidoreductase n=1 Tax=Nocardioides mangrovicus TaxID=2478913 RepID=A0A3L8NZC3_9ACTN|nr:mycofactocin-coupled SDR family oxidoreductase [Nocardioides mangrovicus]RLV47448.1 NAD(P)-dependent oxidoreductase [Nocardioides mangrovicus]